MNPIQIVITKNGEDYQVLVQGLLRNGMAGTIDRYLANRAEIIDALEHELIKLQEANPDGWRPATERWRRAS